MRCGLQGGGAGETGTDDEELVDERRVKKLARNRRLVVRPDDEPTRTPHRRALEGQSAFVWPERFEQPSAYWSYVQYPERVRVWRYIGPHCIDLSWPWWQPWRLA